MFGELLPLAVGNLLRARARLAMTSGGVLVGTTAVVLLIALTLGLQQSAEAGIGSNVSLTEIDVYQSWNPDPDTILPQLTVDAVRAFWQIPGVEVVIPMVNVQYAGELIAGDFRGWGSITGLDPALLPYINLYAAQGEISLQPGDVLVGSMVGDNFYDPEAEEWSPIHVDLMTEPFEVSMWQATGTTRDVKLNVVGVLQPDPLFDYIVLLPLHDAMKLNEWGSGEETDPKTFRYDRIVVRATSRETANDITKAIRAMGYETSGYGDYLNELNKFFVTMRLMLGGIGGVALLVAAFGVANTMTMAILERTKEIGLMKAIGATDREVLTIFLIEAGLVGLTGGLAGVALSHLLRNAINNAVNAPDGGSGVQFLPFDASQIGGKLIIIPPELSLVAIGLATGVGIIAGLYPALRAAHLPPVAALKQE